MKKRALTLLEIMIVISLITIIIGVVGYNMQGALEKGKVFRTERAIEKVNDLLLCRLAETGDMAEILKDVPKAIRATGLVKDPAALLKDGWGQPLEIQARVSGRGFSVSSVHLKEYYQRHPNEGGSTTSQADLEEF